MSAAPPRGGAWVLVQGALLIGFLILPAYPGRAPGAGSGATHALTIGAVVLWAAGIGLFVSAARGLGRSLTPFPAPAERGRLVRTGAYRLVRHPIYSALILGAAGVAIYWASLPHAAGVLLLFAFFDLKARREEALLRARYPEYDDYRRRVRRLIPWLY